MTGVVFLASARKRADPLGWPFGNLPPAELERARRARDLQQALRKLAAQQPRKGKR